MITECSDQVRAGVRGPAAHPGAGLPPGPRDQAGGGQPLQEEEGEARHRLSQIGAPVYHLFIVNCFMTSKIHYIFYLKCIDVSSFRISCCIMS